MEPKSAHNASFWSRRSAWLCFAVVILVSAIGYWFDRLLVYGGLSRTYMLVVSNTLTGIVTGGLFLYVVRHEKAQRDQIRDRIRTVAELNHYIRNALQVIKLCGMQPESSLDGRQLQLIKESADRIEWALREVLPKYPADEKTVMRQPPVGYAAGSSRPRSLDLFPSDVTQPDYTEHGRRGSTDSRAKVPRLPPRACGESIWRTTHRRNSACCLQP